MGCRFGSCKTKGETSGFVATPSSIDVKFSTERPLHHSEKILEQVLEWSALETPSSAFLVIKKLPKTKRIHDGKGKGLLVDCL